MTHPARLGPAPGLRRAFLRRVSGPAPLPDANCRGPAAAAASLPIYASLPAVLSMHYCQQSNRGGAHGVPRLETIRQRAALHGARTPWGCGQKGGRACGGKQCRSEWRARTHACTAARIAARLISKPKALLSAEPARRPVSQPWPNKTHLSPIRAGLGGAAIAVCTWPFARRCLGAACSAAYAMAMWR